MVTGSRRVGCVPLVCECHAVDTHMVNSCLFRPMDLSSGRCSLRGTHHWAEVCRSLCEFLSSQGVPAAVRPGLLFPLDGAVPFCGDVWLFSVPGCTRVHLVAPSPELHFQLSWLEVLQRYVPVYRPGLSSNVDLALFLVHHGGDSKIQLVGLVSHLLVRLGAKHFFDRNMTAADRNNQHAMRWACTTADVALVVFSQNFFKSPWAVTELFTFLTRERTGNHQRVHPVFFGVRRSCLRDSPFPLLADEIAGHISPELEAGEPSWACVPLRRECAD